MFAPTYYATTYFAPTYWPVGGSIPAGAILAYFPPGHFAGSYFAPSYWPGSGPGGASTSPASPIEALCAWWTAHATLPDLAGDLWHGMAPRRTPMPFAVITEIADVRTDTFHDDLYYHVTTLQIAVFASSYRDAKAIGLTALTALQSALLTIGGAGVCGSNASAGPLELLSEQGPGGSDVHQQVLEITVTWVP